jgi:hypothetical protein
MKRITALTIFALGVILVFSTCATLDTLLKPELNTVTIHFADGDVITYVLPPEFPELDENQLQYLPIYYGYAVVARQEIGENVYGLILAGPDAEIIAAGRFIGDEDTWWIYENGRPVTQTDDSSLVDLHIEEYVTKMLENTKTGT